MSKKTKQVNKDKDDVVVNIYGEIETIFDDCGGYVFDCYGGEKKDEDRNAKIVYKTGIQATSTMYSDRMWQWDSEKYNRLCEKYWKDNAQVFYGRSRSSVENFLTDYIGNDKKVKIVYIEIQTTMNGYPIWRFDYIEVEDKKNV